MWKNVKHFIKYLINTADRNNEPQIQKPNTKPLCHKILKIYGKLHCTSSIFWNIYIQYIYTNEE